MPTEFERGAEAVASLARRCAQVIAECHDRTEYINDQDYAAMDDAIMRLRRCLNRSTPPEAKPAEQERADHFAQTRAGFLAKMARYGSAHVKGETKRDLCGLYKGKSAKTHELIRKAFGRGVLAGFDLCWQAAQKVYLADAEQEPEQKELPLVVCSLEEIEARDCTGEAVISIMPPSLPWSEPREARIENASDVLRLPPHDTPQALPARRGLRPDGRVAAVSGLTCSHGVPYNADGDSLPPPLWGNPLCAVCCRSGDPDALSVIEEVEEQDDADWWKR